MWEILKDSGRIIIGVIMGYYGGISRGYFGGIINDSFPSKMTLFSCCKTCQAGSIREYIKNDYQYEITWSCLVTNKFSSYLSSDNGIDDVHSSFSSHPENNESLIAPKSITSSPRPVSESSKLIYID